MSRKLPETSYSIEIYQHLHAGLQHGTGFTQLPIITSTQFRLAHGRKTPANNTVQAACLGGGSSTNL